MGDDRYRPDRPIFCGNFEYDAPVRDIERLFDKYGVVERVDMKTGFAFVYMKDRRDGEDAIDALDGREFGYRRRRLKVEWAKGNGEVKKREEVRRRQAKPTTTLFVANFDVNRTRERDLERVFDKYGPLTRVQIKRNYAFVQYVNLDDAERALNETQGMKYDGRPLAVEYVANEMNARGDRSRSRSPAYRSRRSPSPARRRTRSRDARSRSPKRRSRSPRRVSPAAARDNSPDRGDYKRAVSRSRSRSRGRSIGSRSPPPRDLSRSPPHRE